MSKYQDSVLTPAGLLLASKAYAGKTTFKLTRTATTADVLTTDGIKKLTMLPNEVQAGTIAQSDNVVSDDHTLITTELLFTNQDLAKSYQINAIGVYAMEAGTTNEILYSVAIADQAEFMPDFADKVLMEFKTIITMAVGQKSNVTIEMVANNLATQQYVQNAIKDLAQDADVVHDNHDGTIKVNETNFQPVATDGSSKVILPATGTSQTAYDLSNFQQPPITKTDGTATVVVEKGESVALKLWPLAEGLYTLQIKAGAIFTTAPEGYNRTLWWGVTFLSNDRDYFGTIRIWRRQEKGLIPYYMENIVINQEYSGTQMY
ncbi:hypothetical protein [Lactiplantibacillus herbarum]|uniref:hypothetical protein n=1 Tax=Lactiplantibacillus herbarum TaxID=1670446 RepID=UPI00064F6D97|nr:hypothetical protein [Lactiplantibacillus herbarum]